MTHNTCFLTDSRLAATGASDMLRTFTQLIRSVSQLSGNVSTLA